jgi:hypothetical protein
VRAIEKGGWQLRWCILSAWICEVRRHQEARDQKERKGINPFTKGPVVFKARSASRARWESIMTPLAETLAENRHGAARS